MESHHTGALTCLEEASGAALEGLGSLDRALGPRLYLVSSLWTLMLESHSQIITFQVLGEQNCIFIEKNKVDPFFLSP